MESDLKLDNGFNNTAVLPAIKNFAFNILSRKGTIPIFKLDKNITKAVNITFNITGGGTYGDPPKNTVRQIVYNETIHELPEFSSSKYVGAFIILDVVTFAMIILLAVSAMRAYRFMANKDRILLFHFLFLLFSVFCKMLSYLMAALYYSNSVIISGQWLSFFVVLENLGFVFFFIASSLSLFKWILVMNRIEFYACNLSLQEFEDKKKSQLLIFIASIVSITALEVILIAIDASIEDDEDAIVIDRIVNISYSVIGLSLTILFVITGSLLLKTLNHNFEDIYEDKKSSIRLGISVICCSLSFLSIRFIYQEIFQDFFVEMKTNSLIQDNWDFTLYDFISVFIFELAPIFAQIILIWIAVKRDWNVIYDDPVLMKKSIRGSRDKNIKIKDEQKNKLSNAFSTLMTEDNDFSMGNQDLLQKVADMPQMMLGQQRSNYISSELAFEQNQVMFIIDYYNKSKETHQDYREDGSESMSSYRRESFGFPEDGSTGGSQKPNKILGEIKTE